MGGRHPRVPHAPPGSYRSPSRLLSKHIAACPLVQALKTPRWTLTTYKGEGVRFGSGRAFWTPFWARPSLFPGPMRQGFLCTDEEAWFSRWREIQPLESRSLRVCEKQCYAASNICAVE